MIKFEHTEVVGWEAAIRGMRNPLESWDKSDSISCENQDCSRCPANDGDFCNADCIGGTVASTYSIGKSDHDLMMRLRDAGSSHRKFMRMIQVYVDITAPQFWWAEFDTYKVATVRNSCSKMHKIHVHPFTLDMFSHEGCDEIPLALEHLEATVNLLEVLRQKFNETQEKRFWRALIELLPSGYNMKATVMLNYETLAGIHQPDTRMHHKLLEWNVEDKGSFCQWIESLPYSELITG